MNRRDLGRKGTGAAMLIVRDAYAVKASIVGNSDAAEHGFAAVIDMDRRCDMPASTNAGSMASSPTRAPAIEKGTGEPTERKAGRGLARTACGPKKGLPA